VVGCLCEIQKVWPHVWVDMGKMRTEGGHKQKNGSLKIMILCRALPGENAIDR